MPQWLQNFTSLSRWLDFFSLLLSIYLFLVNSAGFEILISSHYVEEICIWYGWTKLHCCNVLLNLCIFWRLVLRLWPKKTQEGRSWYIQNHTQLLCSAKFALLLAIKIATNHLSTPCSRTLACMVTTGSPVRVKMQQLLFNIQKLKSCM